ncbi:MAG: MerR family transcriptional regulator [Chloroflexi bacterium]|nr:MerR family transcriptional regulator [Chloroflexota bacterium]
MRAYTIGQLAKMAGVSVRTLHHYDQIGLLEPTSRTAAGYRLYGEADLLRLQQILFFKELEMPLDEVRQVLDDPDFDQVTALQRHRQMVEQRMERLSRLLGTIDRTIERLREGTMGLTDDELYEGFSKETRERYRREARERYGVERVEASERKAKQMSKEEWKAVGAEGEAVTQALAALVGRDPSDPEVQAQVARHHAWVEHFYPCGGEVYRGLATMYVDHPEFRAHYEKYRAGLAEFLSAAMLVYAERVLDKAARP